MHLPASVVASPCSVAGAQDLHAEGPVPLPCCSSLWCAAPGRTDASAAPLHCATPAGNLLGLLLSPILLVNFGWRSLFYIFGILGAPLLAMWLTAVPNKQDSKQDSTQQQVAGSSSPDELQAAPASSSVNALTLMSKLPTWAIIIVNFVNHWGYFIYLNWMPSYFNKVLGLDLRASSLVSFLPWLVMAAGSSFAGVLADGLVSKGVPVTTVRKALQTVAFLVPAVALLLLANPAIQPGAAVACMTVALGTTSLGQAGFVANMSDIAPKHAGKMFGLCNTFGSLAGILGVVAVGYIYEATGSFNLVFQATAAMYLAATIAWNLLATGEKVFD